MLRGGRAVLAAAMMAATGAPAAAQVLDATYRGTMLCDKLPFKPLLDGRALRTRAAATCSSVGLPSANAMIRCLERRRMPCDV